MARFSFNTGKNNRIERSGRIVGPSARWIVLVTIVVLAISVLLWLPWYVQRVERGEKQEQLIADTLWVEQTIRFQFARDEEALLQLGQELAESRLSTMQFRARAGLLIKNNRELQQIRWIAEKTILNASPEGTGEWFPISLSSLRAQLQPYYLLRKYPAKTSLDYVAPIRLGGEYVGSIVASYSPQVVLDEMVPWWFAQENEVHILDSDDFMIAKRSAGGGKGVYTHRRSLDFPGVQLSLKTNSIKGRPKLFSNLLVVGVVGLSAALLISVWLLWRDMRRRFVVEAALREQVAVRTAMENSLVTGLRARDLNGLVTYVNPAFCKMVGYPAHELVGKAPPMPYWAPEAMAEYQERFAQVLAGTITPQGFETIFQRADGIRFPVLIFEAPLVNKQGIQTGWMGSILDITEQKQTQALIRQQEEKLQSTARLTTMGELASTLAHELNQPLAAISSYCSGALNLAQSQALTPTLLHDALSKILTQAQRAGQIIRSVHQFVKRRESQYEQVDLVELVQVCIPLIELQAREHFVQIRLDLPAEPAWVMADRVMLEQTLLNLTRNAVEAMQHTPTMLRRLDIWVTNQIEVTTNTRAPMWSVWVADRGHGISAEVARQLFSPFFSTKSEGMGMGLKICRSTIESLGGSFTFFANTATLEDPHQDKRWAGTVFRFDLPAQLLPDTSSL